MQKLIISLICCLLPTLAIADKLSIRENAPDRYVVVKGDTLWDISAKFFSDPWKWPQIWGLNKDSIKNPHWIYPGDVVVLDRAAATLKVEGGSAPTTGNAPATANAESGVAATQQPPQTEKAGAEPQVEHPVAEENSEDEENQPHVYNGVRLSPRIREQSGQDAISTIPLGDIEPFLKRPLVINEGDLDSAPVIIAGYEGRSLLSNKDIAYVKNLPANKGVIWQIYRPGKALIDPVDGNVLGHEVTYLGNARVEKFDRISTLRIFGAKLEIYPGDRLARASSGYPGDFIPMAPDKEISASVMSIVGGVAMAGQRAVVVINKGSRDGIQVGHVLALYRKGEHLRALHEVLPNMRYGLIFVFRTFEKVSYALVMQTQFPVELEDLAQTP